MSLSLSSSSSSSFKEPPPKLGSWSVVCHRLYTSIEKRRLLGYPARMGTAELSGAFFQKIMAGEIYQTPEDWKNLQRRLHSRGYSDDLTLLQESMAAIVAKNQEHMEPPATTPTPTPTTTLDTSPSGKKRTIMDCHNENGKHQEDDPHNPVHDYENLRKKIKLTIRDRIKLKLDVMASDGTDAAKVKIFKDFLSAVQPTKSTANPTAAGDGGHWHSLDALPFARDDRPLSPPVVIPLTNETGQETPPAVGAAAAVPGHRVDMLLYKERIENAFFAALKNFNENQGSPLDSSSVSSSGNSSITKHGTRIEPNVGVVASTIDHAASTLATSTLTTPLPPASTVVVLAETTNFVPPAVSHPIVTQPSNAVLSSAMDANQDVVVISNSPTTSPMDEPSPEINPPVDVTESTTESVPTEGKETLLVRKDSPLQTTLQHQQPEEESSMTLAIDDTNSVVVVPNNGQHSHQGHFPNAVITLAVWSIALHGFLWTVLGTMDYSSLLDKNPMRICLSMETYGLSKSPSMTTTMLDTNLYQGPWLGNEGEDAATATSFFPRSSSSMLLQHRLCTPWYGLMSLALGLLVSLWLVSQVVQKILVVRTNRTKAFDTPHLAGAS